MNNGMNNMNQIYLQMNQLSLQIMSNINIIMTNMNQMMNNMNLMNKLINDLGTYQISNNNMPNVNIPFNFNNQIKENIITLTFEVYGNKEPECYNIQCSLKDKISDVINKFRITANKTSEIEFIFNAIKLNPNLTVEETKLKNLSKIAAIEPSIIG